jgi:hypothetical protein
LEIEEEAEFEARGVEVVEALGGVFGGQMVCALEFNDDLIFDDDIREVLTHTLTFIGHGEGYFGNCG